jgi:hypothetical protein
MADTFRNAPKARENAARTLALMAQGIRGDVEHLLLTPDLSISFKVIESYAAMLASVEKFAESCSNSNPGYWRRDLPPEVAEDLLRARHILRVLDTMYCPVQAAPAEG